MVKRNDRGKLLFILSGVMLTLFTNVALALESSLDVVKTSLSSSYSVSTGGTSVAFDTVNIDTVGGVGTSAQAWSAGLYQLRTNFNATFTQRLGGIRVNGSYVDRFRLANEAQDYNFSAYVDLQQGDQVDIYFEPDGANTGLIVSDFSFLELVEVKSFNSNPSHDVVRTTLSSNFNLPSGTTSVPFDAVVMDTVGTVGTSAQSWDTGLYEIKANFNSTATQRLGGLRVNGAYVDRFFLSSGAQDYQFSAYVQLNQGDQIDLYFESGNTGTIVANDYSFLEVSRVNQFSGISAVDVVRASLSSNVDLPAAATSLTFDTVEFDTVGGVGTSGEAWVDGLYEIRTNFNSTATQRLGGIRVNGVYVDRFRLGDVASDYEFSTFVQLQQGDQIDVYFEATGLPDGTGSIIANGFSFMEMVHVNSVPEPSSLAILTLGGFICSRRRRLLKV